MIKVITTLLFVLIAITCVSAQTQVDSKHQCTPNGEQRNITTYFEVPEFIATGLTDGSMERVGGVIRYSDDLQTIAWLRQGGQMGQVAESTAGLLEHVTRLSGSGHLALGQFLASVTPFLNISMAGFSLIEHITGIRAHEEELERIYDRVSEEFQRNREVELLAALSFAENSFTARSTAYKHEAVVHVSYELTIARAQLMRDLAELLRAEMNNENSRLAMTYQILAMKVCALSARLRLEIGEDDAALDGLSQCVAEHEDYVERFVRKWLGNRRALYFHESVDDQYFESYLSIERWLRGQRDVLPDIVRAYRRGFWDDTVTEALYTRIGLNKVLVENPFYQDSLPNSEILIENYQRLVGFEQELQSMCVPTFSEWEAFEGDEGVAISDHDGFVMLVNQALIDGDRENSP